MRLHASALALLLLTCCRDQAACHRAGAALPTAPRCSTTQTDAYLKEHRAEYETAMARAEQWVDALPVDPVELRKQGRKTDRSDWGPVQRRGRWKAARAQARG